MKCRIGGLLILLAITLHGISLCSLVAETFSSLSQSTPDGAQTIDKGKLRDITGIEPTPFHPSVFPRWVLGVGIAVLILTILGLTCWKLNRVNRKKTGPNLDQWVIKELDHIETLGLPAKGKGDEFHTRLEKAIRKYLELQFQISALTQTTGELLSIIQSSSFLSPSHQEILQELLKRCEQAKFAKAKFSFQECQDLLSKARALVKLHQTFPTNALIKK